MLVVKIQTVKSSHTANHLDAEFLNAAIPHVTPWTQILENVNLGVQVEVQKLLKRVHGLTSRSGVYILVGMTAGLTPTANPPANYRVI